ncbi:MAG: UDP-N-acetylmuramate dehydrogenase [Anaerovoracaceae bacterium]|jgi:UDP-N-acetylmuramate dehydrogenase
MKILKNVDMKKYTSFRAGGSADIMFVPENEDELMEAVRKALEMSGEYYILGNGTDTLVTDDGLRKPVIMPGEGFSDISVDGSRITCGSAALLSKIASAALDAGLSGMEFASGIPGSAGGAVFMNAGAYGGEMKDIVSEVRVVKADGSGTAVIGRDELDLSYRHSVLKETGDIVCSVSLELTPGNKDEIKAKMKDLNDRRKAKQPLTYPSAGSFFKRPEGHFAGKLIEDAGLRGLAVGGAQVSEKHCGFIINTGGATACDIIRLMRLVQNTVMDDSGVRLEPEVRIVGEMPPDIG